MKRFCLFLALMLALCIPALAVPIENAESSCRVWIDGAEALVYETAVCNQRYWTANPELSSAPVAIAQAQGSCRVEAEFLNAQVHSAVVRPLSLGVVPEIADGKVCFTLPAPAKCTVEINGDTAGALHLFVDAPDADKPDPDAANVQYFGPGVHTNVLITAKSNQTIYIDAGAIVYGQIFCGMGSNFTIAGHGVLCGSIYDRYADTIVPVSITNAHDFTIRDITILDPSAWTVNLYKCKNAVIDNVKIIGARSNSDGITMQNVENVLVQNCFVRSWDDNLVVKGYNGNVDGVTCRNCILWTDLAQSCEIGYETRAQFICNITFEDITVLHSFHKPVISIHNSDSAAVRQVAFRNITVEDARMGAGDGAPYLIDLTKTKSQWSVTSRRGTIDQVSIQHVSVLSGNRPVIRIWSDSAEAPIDHVTIDQLEYQGETIEDFDQVVYEASPYNGPDIRLQGVSAPGL